MIEQPSRSVFGWNLYNYKKTSRVDCRRAVMQLFGFVFILVAVLVLAFAVRTKPNDADRSSSRTGKRTAKGEIRKRNPWRATSIVHDHPACAAVKAIHNKRFLETEKKVLLPLSNCEASSCSCSYVCHDDRRAYDEDRRHPASLKSKLYDETGEINRRYRKRGRRKLDWA